MYIISLKLHYIDMRKKYRFGQVKFIADR